MPRRLRIGRILLAPLAPLLNLYLRLALATTRWRIEGLDHLEPFATARPAIVGFWHERLALTPPLWKHTKQQGIGRLCYVLISRHRDGQFIARIAESFGAQVVTGSTSTRRKKKGGASAQRKLLTALEEGDLVALTPDGPRGPRRQAAPGIAQLAAISGVPILPVGAQTTRRLRLPSWDRFTVPLPFARGVIVCGPPLTVPRELYEDALPAIERALDAVANQADTLCAPRHPGRLSGAIWAAATTLAAPWLRRRLRARAAAGRELAPRLAERYGQSPTPRPDGRLVWLHASSVGEATSALSLLAALPGDLHLLVTTGTVTGAALLAGRLPPDRATHVFVPWDVPAWCARFLDHWRPDLACFVESELWPNLIAGCVRRGIPLALVNGRLSARSADRWERVPGLARRMLGAFRLVRAGSEEDAARLSRLGAQEVRYEGNLKFAAPRLPVEVPELERLRALLAERPLWLAASTHPGEEAIIAEVASRLAADHPGLLTIVVPRHAERGAEIAELLGGAPRRSLNQDPGAHGFWVGDTMGELGLYLRLSRLVFMGKSLVEPGGGQNPIEPAQVGCAVAIGPHHANFAGIVRTLRETEAIAVVSDGPALAAWLGDLLSRPPRAGRAGRAARQAVNQGREVADRVAAELVALLP
jgi:3-deoxy-D-manno-octulosonic-acid transferase